MNNITLTSVNWNQQPCVELLLKSYVRHHYTGEPLKLRLVDNGSTDGSPEWLHENKIPFTQSVENIGHENALNCIYNTISTKYCLLNDTDVEYHSNIFGYLEEMKGDIISVGELIDKNYMNDVKIKDRISPWVWLFDIDAMRNNGVKYFRDPSVEDWTYDVGSWHWEQMKTLGYGNFNLSRKPGNQDEDLISMRYGCVDHIGKVSWNLDNHGDRYGEVMRRRAYIKERLKLYEDVDLTGKFCL